MEPMLFGQILLNFHLITEKELNRCLHIQNHIDYPKPLGKILLERGLIDLKLLSTILTVQKRELNEGVAELGMTAHEVAHRLRDRRASSFLSLTRDIEASSLHLTTGKKPMVRLHGSLTDLPVPPLDPKQCDALISELLTPDQRKRLEKQRRLDVCTTHPVAGRFRANVFRHHRGVGGVFRVIRDHARTLSELDLPASVPALVEHRSGLILVTGPAGSGKTSTLGAFVNRINKTQRRHILTFEDPIETVIESDQSLVTQRQIGVHTQDFASGLRSSLREDPDVIVVSNLRDPEAFALALTAAETGQLVIGALHTRSAYGTVVRCVEQFPPARRPHIRTMLAGTLRAVITHELIPTVRGGRRILASEVMIVNSAISGLIREDRDFQIPSEMAKDASGGSILMDDELERLMSGKLITVEEAIERATDRTRFLVPT